MGLTRAWPTWWRKLSRALAGSRGPVWGRAGGIVPGNGKWWRKGVVAAGVVLVSLMTLSSGRDSVTVRRWLSVACRSITGTSAKAGTFYECNPTYVVP